MINPTDRHLTHETGISNAIISAAGEPTRRACDQYITLHHQLPLAVPLDTTAGDLEPRVKTILHVTADQSLTIDKLADTYYACLSQADAHPNVAILATPVVGTHILHTDPLLIAEHAANSLLKFDADTAAHPGSLREIKFVVLSLTMADALTASFRLAWQATATNTAADDNPPNETVTNPSEEWFAIDRILRQRKRNGRSQYLVRWSEPTCSPSWVDFSDITDAALAQFYANKTTRRRRRRRRQ